MLAEDADDSAEVPPLKAWAKPTMRSLVAGWFGNLSPDGVYRDDYHEGCSGTLTYPPSSECKYMNPPS